MTYTEAIQELQNQCDNLSGDEKSFVQVAIDVLNNSGSSQPLKLAAMNTLNDAYWDFSITDATLFGEATFVVSRTVDPIKPFPAIKI